MSEKSTASMRRRLFGVIGLVIVLFTVTIISNLIVISIKDNNKYQNLANNQQFASRTIHANRGTIKDTNGQIIAQSATVYNVFIDPVTYKKYDTKKHDLILSTLSETLEVDKEKIEKYLSKNSGYEVVKRKVEKSTADKIREFIKKEKIASIGCDPDTLRYYPQNDLAASVIGFTNYDGNGIYGIEKQYDEFLTGIDGRIVSAKDAMGHQMPYRYEQSFDAQDGNSLVLNIDLVLQHYVEKELKKAVTSNMARNRGCAIVMNCKTGQILAMATEPDFDLNNPREITDPTVKAALSKLSGDELTKQTSAAWDKQWKNKAITELYNPGSVFKVVTGSAALEEKVIDLNTKFHCSGGVTIGGKHISCWKPEGHGTQNFVKAMTNSCNPAFMDIGQRLGVHKFSQYLKSYGITEPSGIDLPGEATSIVRGENVMTTLDLAVSSFGQSLKITPLEMITAYAAVVNGGKLVTPYVVNRVVDSNNNVIKQYEPVIKRQVISEETSKTMRETLESVVITNGGSNAYIQGYRIGGKSGTSQKIDEYGPVEGKNIYVSSYVGFAPANDPEIIMLVMVDEPKGGKYFGSLVAAPVVSTVFEEALPYLGYFKEYTQEEYSKLNVVVPSVIGKDTAKAVETLKSLYVNPQVVGSGTKVVKQIPAAGAKMPKNGKIYLFTEENLNEQLANVPDVTNMSLQDANKAITNAGLNFMATGGAANSPGAFAVSQTGKGQKLPKGSVVEVKFVTNNETG